MHELQVTERILGIVLKYASADNASKVISINLKIGELSDLEDEWLQDYFNYLSKDTIAEEAKLKIERVPVVMECDECGHSFTVNIREIRDIECPECGNKQSTLISGREYQIQNLEVI